MFEQSRASWGKASWGKTEYITRVPRWLQLGLLLCGLVGMMSDVSFIFRTHASGPLQAWFLAEVALSYLAAGISLISARAAIILVALAMATTFLEDHQPFFPLIPVIVVALVASALCGKGLIIAHCSLTILWGTLITWQRGTLLRQQMIPEAFWWMTLWSLLLGSLVGLAIRYLVIRTAKTRDELQKAKARADQIRHEERQDLARELHDVVAHHITVITMQVMSRRHSQDPAELRETLSIIDDSAREALNELRALLDLLRADEDHGHLPPSQQALTGPNVQMQVENHIQSLTQLGFRVTSASVDPRVESLPLSTKTTSVRIVQESTTNIIKHAMYGASCAISLTLRPTELHIRITNNRPKPPEHSVSTGYGLTSLKERVLALGGRYKAERQGDQWVVEACLPVHKTR